MVVNLDKKMEGCVVFSLGQKLACRERCLSCNHVTQGWHAAVVYFYTMIPVGISHVSRDTVE